MTYGIGKYYDAAKRSSMYIAGMALNSINNATFTTGTLGNTCTPVLGLWNPSSSGVNAVLLRATLGITLTALAATGGAPFVWAISTGNNAISTGVACLNALTLSGAAVANLVGSVSKCVDVTNVALTGLTNNLTARFASCLGGGSYSNQSFTATAAGPQTIQRPTVELFDGGLIVPPGGVLALLATTTPVAHSAASALHFVEQPA